MRERPILFSAPMVRAILDGRKSQTRRVVKQHLYPLGYIDGDWYAFDHKGINYRVNTRHTTTSAWANLLQFCPYGQPGDRLWVREAWAHATDFGNDTGLYFWRATHTNGGPYDDVQKWKPSIHMPRWASRILLEITAVRVERLNDIREADAWAEGCLGYDDDVTGGQSGYSEFAELWESINGPGSWDANPWVWVIEFRVVYP